MSSESELLFESMLDQTSSFMEKKDWDILQTHGKPQALAELHLTVGGRIRHEFKLWDKSGSDCLMAIYLHSGQDLLPGLDADAGSQAILECLWDKVHGIDTQQQQ